MADHPGSQQAIGHGRLAALLNMPDDVGAHVIRAIGRPLQQLADELGGVRLRGAFVADRQEKPSSGGKTGLQPGHIAGEFGQPDPVLVQIDPFGPTGQPAHQRLETAIASHRLDDEGPGGGRTTQFDHVDRVDADIQRRVGPNRQFGAGQVVVDGRRHRDDRHLEGRVAVPLGVQQIGGLVGIPAADDQQRGQPQILHRTRDLVEILPGRHPPAQPQLGTAGTHPALHIVPAEVAGHSLAQSAEPVADADHPVAPGDAQPDGHSRGGVHARHQPAGVHDPDPVSLCRSLETAGIGQLAEDVEQLIETRATGGHRRRIVTGPDQLRHLPGGLHRRHQRDPHHPVAQDAHHPGGLVLGGVEHLIGRFVAEPGRRPAVVCRGRAATLHMAQDRHPGVLGQPFGDHLPDVFAADRLAGPVGGALGHHDDGIAPASGAAHPQHLAHLLLPAVGRWILRDEHVIAAPGDGCRQGQIAAMAAHDLQHEATLMAGRGAGDRVQGIQDAMQCGVGPDGGIHPDQVVVDRPHQPGDDQVPVPVGHLRAHLAGGHQPGEQFGPFGAEGIQPGQRAVAADHHQPVDAVHQQIAGRLQASLGGAELLAAEGTDNGAAPAENAADVIPTETPDPVPAIDHPLIALVDRVDLGSPGDGGAHHRAYRGVHALGVAAAGQHADTDRLSVSGLSSHGRPSSAAK